MAAKDKKQSRKSKAEKKGKKFKVKPDLAKEAGEMKDSALKFLAGVEKSGDKLTREVKHFFEQMAENVSTVASSAAKTTASVTEKVTSTDSVHHLSRVMEEVKDAGGATIRAVGEGFDALHQHILDLTPGDGKKSAEAGGEEVVKAAVKKPAAKKKAATKKTAKKPVAKKKAATKKTAKKPAAKKKTTAKKVAKKPVAKKKATAKKVAKKPIAAKKAPQK